MNGAKRLVYERNEDGFYDEPVFSDDDYTDDECIDDLCSLGWSVADARDFIGGD
jgi:hypothetical protein